ncbi:cell wall hydrolase [Desulfoscipio geothermicus]|uniref:N-acetylmuramoyl-L-alanine amidase n=1 Tax=Desulfoscipio geothermicus DSM 3669 TaxID=1121426 RepID=A0A1I6DMA3_9FIRM|nr:cell wall hydrolase [Desulfoscipio geothermicus]SFR06521.1 N-acetylmuramoyl-L-alanine amidase [Desulfoscipio geothermicus DSM 3669]
MSTHFFRVTGVFLLVLLCISAPVSTAHADTGTDMKTTTIIVKYTVQPGDTLSEIAQTFNIEVDRLMRANNLKTSVIHPYQVLFIPAGNNAAGKNTSRGSVSREDLLLLAKAIYAEARGESFLGQVAVGAVIVNRVQSPHFPNTVREVIFQRNRHICQFTPVSDGTINLTPDRKAIRAAETALEGYDPTGGALFFYNPRIASDNWIKSLPVVTQIGRHVFATKT